MRIRGAHRVRFVARSLPLALLLTPVGGAGAQHSEPEPLPAYRLPDSPTGRLFPRFLEAYNTGRLDRLHELFVPFDSLRAPSRAAYWKGVYNEYGPVALVSVDTSRALTRFQVRGRLSRAWAGFVLEVDDGPNPSITVLGVVRGERPPGRPPTERIPPDRLPAILEPYLAALAEAGHFSGAVVVAKDGDVIFEGAYGEADRRHGIRNALDTRFAIASMTKMLTAVAVLQLVERGELALDDPLAHFVPEYPDRIGSRVTVRHLLTHTSGIELDDHAPFNLQVARARSVEGMLQAQLDHIANLNRGPPDSYEVPDGFDYTNEGYDLLGVITERVSGRAWEDLVRETVLVPAGMRDTGFVRDVPVARLATGYTRGSNHPEGERRENHFLLSPFARPSGNAYATAGDVARLLEALRNHELLGPHLTREATSRQVVWPGIAGRSYGYGFMIDEGWGARFWGHGGSQPGVSARAHVYPDLDYTIVVLSNFEEGAIHVAAYLHELVSAGS